MPERIVISSDHAGYDLKCYLAPFISSLGYEVEDVGAFSKESVDYPDYTLKAAQKVASGECFRGIVFCGTGQGDAMVANKVPGIRAALCWNEFTARMSRAHNDANILVMGGWVTANKTAEEMIRLWLSTPFDGGRHQRRLDKLAAIERDMRLKRGQIYDITQMIKPGMPVWPGDKPVAFQKKTPQCVNSLTNLMMSAHTGTHVDAPSHILPGGADVSGLDVEQLTGLARVCQTGSAAVIDRVVLESLNLEGVTRLLLHTANSDLLASSSFEKAYAPLTLEAAHYLVRGGVRLLAVDYLSVDEYDTSIYPVHRVLLEAGVIIVEGVDMRGVPAGDYELLCLPLKIEGCDGAPARVILRSL